MTRVADQASLDRITALRAVERDFRETRKIELMAQLDEETKPYTEDVDQAVLEAKRAGNTVTAMAQAWARKGGTNRHAIYEILAKYGEDNAETAQEWPFRWEFGIPHDQQEYEDNGWTEPVWRIVLDAKDYGPDKINGHFEWQAHVDGWMIPALADLEDFSDERIYPGDITRNETTNYEAVRGFYQASLWQWRINNPPPNGE